MKIIVLLPLEFGAPHHQCIGSTSCTFSISPKERQGNQRNAREKPQESSQVVQTSKVELARCRCIVHWRKLEIPSREIEDLL